MITSTIGKTFLEEYKRRFSKNITAKEFFVNEFFPLFYNHDKFMQWVHNSPFFQLQKDKDKPEKRKEALTILIRKIETENEIASNTAPGFAASDILALTSGQVSNIDYPFTSEEIYCAWIGAALGLTVYENDMTILFANPEILISLYEGWGKYREFLDNTPNLQAHKINQWNSIWLCHYFENPEQFFSPLNEELNKNNEIEIKKVGWVQLLFALSKKVSNQSFTGYIYKFGQKLNTTIGFIPFILPEISKPLDFYKSFYKDDFAKSKKQMELVLGTAHTFIQSCEKGIIGLQALEPKELKEFIPNSKGDAKMPDYIKADDTQKINYNIYLIWIIAMLNNKELFNKAEDYAKILIDFEKKSDKVSERGLTIKEQSVKTILNATKLKVFIDELSNLFEDGNGNNEKVHQLAEDAIKIPAENFSLFITLIRFKYNYLKSK
ncbi:MAG: hypothetical protein ACOCWM_01690 [Cyclobacteriaceae bacterium]